MLSMCSKRGGGVLILETPELSGNLREGCYALFYHQHLMYFDAFSIENVVRKFGFAVIDTRIDNGNLRLVVRKLGERTSKKISYEKNPDMPDKLKKYRSALDRYLDQTELFLEEFCREEQCICYGAGGGTTLLFHLNPRLKDLVECVVDSSVHKIGKKIGGTPFVIQAPAVLADLFNRNIIINSIEYFDEISRVLQERYEEHNFCHFRITPTLEKFRSSHTVRK